jgi:hypothetical protein
VNGLWVRALRAFFSVAFVIVSGSILLAAAPAGDYGPWRWNTELPSQLRKAPTIRADRTPEAVAHLFGEHPSLARVLETLGPPDAFSRQSIYSRTEGTVRDMATGGTLRFVLVDEDELHVQTADFVKVGQAIRWLKSGKGELLAK